jgi:hypothetical protein
VSQRSVDPQRVVENLSKIVAQQAVLIAQLQAYIEEREQENATT